MIAPLTGLIAAPFTAFHPDGSLNLETIPQQAAHLIHNGVSGAFVCGTTGEGSSLTLEERMRVAAAWQPVASNELKLFVHVGSLNLGDSRRLARHAQDIGAYAIASIAPSFHKPTGPAELVAWCQEVASAAPDLPFYYYHMPSMTAVNISAHEFLTADSGRIGTLRGIKFTNEDLEDYRLARAFAPDRLEVLFGRDEILLDALKAGAAAAVGSTYNYAAPVFLRIMQAYADGDLATATAEQRRVREFVDVLERHGGLPAGKRIMSWVGIDCGPMRLPVRSLDDNRAALLKADLEQIGFFDYCSRQP